MVGSKVSPPFSLSLSINQPTTNNQQRPMPYLVFDIETAAVPFDSLADSQQELILRGTDGNQEQEAERKRQMSLNPFTAQVAAIGMLYAEDLSATEPKTMIFSNSTTPPENDHLPDGSIWRCMPEAELLEAWWHRFERASERVVLVTFNGRSFDCPFLMLRSAVLRVRPSRNLMAGTRWNFDGHIDLQAELAFKEFERSGPTKRWNFDFYCKAFGITSPKEEGITGNDVARLFTEGKHQTIAEYCMRDVRATWEVFKVWKEFIDGIPSR